MQFHLQMLTSMKNLTIKVIVFEEEREIKINIVVQYILIDWNT